MLRAFTRTFALSLALLLNGCPGSSAEKSEADAVSRAVTSLRDADNEKKRELLAVLRDTPCSFEDVCAVRSACLAAYELHVTTLAQMNSVTWLADAQNGAADAVDRMKRDLSRARELASKCTDLQGELIRRHRL